MPQYIIREIKNDELLLLEPFLYEAIYQAEKNTLLYSVIYKPEIYVYIENFNEIDDLCLVVEVDNLVIGAAWARIVNGFGSVDENTPELVIAILEDYRNQGVGTTLMQEMLQSLYLNGYKQVSLSVQKENYAFELYIKLGFEIIKETNDDYIMLYKF